jgi:light-regulated signal transduction histidine kinase (bacteriophytochrome)
MQVLLNLLSNAAKFCRPGAGEVTITLTVQPTELQVNVRDNGIGIAAEHHESIFEKFRQVGDTLTDKPQGTGSAADQPADHPASRAAASGSTAQAGRLFRLPCRLTPARPGRATRPRGHDPT